jgi:hypothetical protein
MSQREMRFRNQHSSTADHQRVSSGIWYRAMATRGLVYVKSLLSGFRGAAPSAASRARRARSCHRDNRHAERVAGFPRLKRLDPRSAIARPEARTAPRSTGAQRRVVAEEASPHQSDPRRDYTASPIPESKSREISKFCGTGRELAWRDSDRTDHSRANAAAVPERSDVRRPRWSYIGRIVTRLPVTFGE